MTAMASILRIRIANHLLGHFYYPFYSCQSTWSTFVNVERLSPGDNARARKGERAGRTEDVLTPPGPFVMNGEIPEKLDLVVRALSRDKTDEEVDTLLHDEVLLPAEAASVMGAGARGAAVRAVGSSRDGNTPHAAGF